MNFSKTFIDRPIATALVMAAILLAGILGFTQLPVAFVPRIEFPTISVGASLPGANPETMASSVAAPLERQLAQIPGLAQMTSKNTLGRTSIALQFELSKNIDIAVEEVQAALAAAAGRLPRTLPTPPTWRKVNPAESRAVLVIGATSDVLPLEQVDDIVDTKLAQQLSQIPGVGQVIIFGEQKPAIRIQVNPTAIANQGISLEDIRTAIALTSINQPKGNFNGPHESSTIDSNDQLLTASAYRDLVVAYRNGAPVRLSDIGTALDSIENIRTLAWAVNRYGILIGVQRQPDANMIEIADRIMAELPRLTASIPDSVKIKVLDDRTTSIRDSVRDVEITLVITIALVIMVIFVFLRRLWSTIIPAVAVPLSLIGAFGAMALFGYSLDNLSLMALTISVGFVVDDAIVMIENIVRYVEKGDTPYQAAVKGAGEIGFTIISITFSLIAVFIPLLLMGGIMGRMFHEFAVTISVAVLISALVSLTLTPTMCARFLGRENQQRGRLYMAAEHGFDRIVAAYAMLLRWVLGHQRITALSLLATIGLSVALFVTIPKGFFPLQDTGYVNIISEAAQNSSFEDMVAKQQQVYQIAASHPAVARVEGTIGGGGVNTGEAWVFLKPFSERTASDTDVMAYLRPQLAKIVGLRTYMTSPQDITIGSRQARTLFQYTLQDQDIDELSHWSDIMFDKLKHIPQVTDVATDQLDSLSTSVVKVDRKVASRLGIQPQQIDDTLYDAFGQRQIATIFTQLNQYQVILEVDPKFQQSPTALDKLYVKSGSGVLVPLGAFSSVEQTVSPQSISHQDQFPAVTLSFNLASGVALGDAVSLIQRAESDAQMPATVTASFQGTAQAFQQSLATMPFLILAALVAVYIVLGILYESFIHPLTILSTIPSAGVGALLMLRAFGYPLDVMGLIGIVLLIGIVKKNAIMMIDFALEAERHNGLPPAEAIYRAALLRFRPILMTTMSALFSGLPLMFSSGAGMELRRPLGYAIVGGLILSQILTLFTTPVVYLYLGRFGAMLRGEKTGAEANLPVATFPGAAE